MKNNLLSTCFSLGALAVCLFGFAGCEKDDNAKEDEGLSEEIKSFMPDSTIQTLRAMGMEINEGKNPPVLEGIYLSAPRLLVNSNFDDSYNPGDQFADEKIKIYDQDSEKLTALLDVKEIGINSGNVIGESKGSGTFLAGNGNKFTLFIQSEGYLLNQFQDTAKYLNAEIYSGELTDDGIKNLQTALVVLNDYGDPLDELIGINEGRLFKDEDGLAETQSTFRIGVPEAGQPARKALPAAVSSRKIR